MRKGIGLLVSQHGGRDRQETGGGRAKSDPQRVTIARSQLVGCDYRYGRPRTPGRMDAPDPEGAGSAGQEQPAIVVVSSGGFPWDRERFRSQQSADRRRVASFLCCHEAQWLAVCRSGVSVAGPGSDLRSALMVVCLASEAAQ